MKAPVPLVVVAKEAKLKVELPPRTGFSSSLAPICSTFAPKLKFEKRLVFVVDSVFSSFTVSLVSSLTIVGVLLNVKPPKDAVED